MQTRTLAPAPLVALAQIVKPTSACQRCPQYQQASSPCFTDAGPIAATAPRLLVVADMPTQWEDQQGEPWSGSMGKIVRARLAAWPGHVRYAYAQRCTGGLSPEALQQCRGHLMWEGEVYAPDRVILLGATAYRAWWGTNPPSEFIAQQGLALPRLLQVGPRGETVIALQSPKEVYNNQFQLKACLEDIEWACRAPALEPRPTQYFIVQGEADVTLMRTQLGAIVGLSFVTSGKPHTPDYRVLCAALATPTQAWLIPAQHLVWLAPVLEDKNLRLYGADVKAMWHAALAVGLSLPAYPQAVIDVGIFARLESSYAAMGLTELAHRVGLGGFEQALEREEGQVRAGLMREAEGKGRKAVGPLTQKCGAGVTEWLAREGTPADYVRRACSQHNVYPYAAMAAMACARLAPTFEASDAHWRAWAFMANVPRVLARIEANGLLLNQGGLRQYAGFALARMREMTSALTYYGLQDPGSHVQVKAWLQGLLGYEPEATHAEALASLAPRHPAIGVLQSWREAFEGVRSLEQKLLQHMAPSGRVHTTFQIGGAATWRLSSTEPNVQNIPQGGDGPLGMVRLCMIPTPGYTHLELDYNQQEIRIGAARSGDEAMIAAFAGGQDFHRHTASIIAPQLWGRPLTAFTPEEQAIKRDKAKRVMLGLFFGMGIESLAREIQGTRAEAEAVLGAILGRYTRFAAWVQECQARTRVRGDTPIIWHREPLMWRQLWDVGSTDSGLVGSALRAAYNTPIQGGGALVTLTALLLLDAWLQREAIPARITLTVHDSILLEARTPELLVIARGAKAIMEGVPNGACPFLVKAKSGPTLAQLQPLPL